MLGSVGGESVHSVAMLERSIPISRLGAFLARVPMPSTCADPNDGANRHPRERRTDRGFFTKGSTPCIDESNQAQGQFTRFSQSIAKWRRHFPSSRECHSSSH